MIRLIAAIDNKRGIATDKGIPWDLPLDRKYYHGKISHTKTLVGRGTYHYLKDRHNVVASKTLSHVFAGDEQIFDAAKYLAKVKKDIWVIGGAEIFQATIGQADELYLTLIDGDFVCTKFFPSYSKHFECVELGSEQEENGITFRFTVWRRKQKIL